MRRFFSFLIGTVFALSTLNVFADNLLSHSVAESAMSQNAEQENTRDSKDGTSKDGASSDVGKDGVSDTSSSKDGASKDVGKDAEPDTVSGKDDVGKDAEPDTVSSKDDVGKDAEPDTVSSKDDVGKDAAPDTGSSKDDVGKDAEPDTGSSKDDVGKDAEPDTSTGKDEGSTDAAKDSDCGKEGCQPELPQINSVWSVDEKDGSLSDSTVQFSAGISLNDGTFELTNNSVKQNTDRFTIKGTITPEAEQIGKQADIIVVAFHRPDPDNLSCDPRVEPDGSGYYMFTRGGDNYLDNYCIWEVNVPTDFKDQDQYKGTKKLPQRDGDELVICRRFEEGQKGKNGQGKNGEERPRKGTRSVKDALWKRWQGNFKTLTPLFFGLPLQAQTTLSLYEDTPPYIGHVCLYFGYWLSELSCQDDDSNCRLIFNGDPIEFSVHE